MKSKLLWKPSKETIRNSHLHEYMNWLEQEKQLSFQNYDDLWEWSVNETEMFWDTVCSYFNVIFHTPARCTLEGDRMPFFKWYEGASLNYAEHIFRNANQDFPAIIHKTEQRRQQSISWSELREQVGKVANQLRKLNVKKGDRVVAYVANVAEATVSFLAVNSLGAIWSSCSPDFGVDSVVERFDQIKPKVIFATEGYSYGGKWYDKKPHIQEISESIDSLEALVLIRLGYEQGALNLSIPVLEWDDWMSSESADLEFESVDFSHPIWVLYSSGTTGKPKAITHSHGGVLLEHLKYLAFHNDVQSGERFFWYSTTGWMMWNFTNAALLMGATIVLYDGSPAYPDLNALWQYAEEAEIHHFGTSAPFIIANMKQGIIPKESFSLDHIRSIGSTGAPLPPEGFDWIYEAVHKDLWLCSMSGGTDVCTAFVGGCILENVYEGEIQRRALGCALYAFDDHGKSLVNEVGEMVITRPMPSMPIYFWGDENFERYQSSYFQMFEGIWRHGDWVKLTERKSLIILGRSDATLNRQGVRIGTAEIYRSVEQQPEVEKALIVNIEKSDGSHYMPLFVKLYSGKNLTEDLKSKIIHDLKIEYSPRHIPDDIISVPGIPLTISGKKMEAPIKKILMGRPVEKSISRDAMQNPDSLAFFIDFFAERLK